MRCPENGGEEETGTSKGIRGMGEGRTKNKQVKIPYALFIIKKMKKKRTKQCKKGNLTWFTYSKKSIERHGRERRICRGRKFRLIRVIQPPAKEGGNKKKREETK